MRLKDGMHAYQINQQVRIGENKQKARTGQTKHPCEKSGQGDSKSCGEIRSLSSHQIEKSNRQGPSQGQSTDSRSSSARDKSVAR